MRKFAGIVAIAAALFVAPALSVPLAFAGSQDDLAITTDIAGRSLTFDWPAVEIGIASYEAGPTGLTIFRFPERVSAVVDVRGGAPGTVNSDLLRLGYNDRTIDAIVLSGGSAYGEEAIAAAQGGLKEMGIRSGDWRNIAVTPGAIIYDFGGRRLNEIHPDKRLSHAALKALRPGVFPLADQGAGRMAMQGGFFGCDSHSGQGGAFRQVGRTKIAAFVVVNALGTVTDRDGRVVKCHANPGWKPGIRTTDILQNLPGSLRADWQSEQPAAGPTANTTIGLIVTNRKLANPLLQRLAVQVHTSMGRGIQPFATINDGDTLFAASTQEIDDTELGPVTLGAIAAEVMWDAILASVPDEPAFAAPAAPVAVPAETLKAWEGDYDFGGGHRLAVRVEKDGLVVQATGEQALFGFAKGKPLTVLASSASDFYLPGRSPTRLSFADGGRLVLNPGRWGQAGIRK